MNWRRGLLRAWVAFSGCWLIFVAILTGIAVNWDFQTYLANILLHPFEAFALLFVALSPPLGLLAAGALLYWIFLGLRGVKS